MENVSLADIAAVTEKGADGFGIGNGGFWIFALIVLLAMSGGGFGNNTASQDIQRAVDLNSIQTGQAGISADIQRGIYEINNNTGHVAYDNLGEIRDVQASVASGFAGLQNCCCDMKSMILENRYIDSQNTAAINANTTAQVQKVLDAVSANRIAELEQRVNTLQLEQATSNVPKISPYMYNITPSCCSY